MPELNATAVSAAPESPNPGLDSAVDTLLTTSDTPAEATPAETPVSSPEAPVDPAQPEGQEVPAEDPQAELDPLDDSDLDKALQENRTNPLDLASSRGKRIYGGYKNYKTISETLGRDVSADEVKQYFESYSDQKAMEYEFASGDPVRAQNWVAHWNNLSPQGMAQVAAQLPNLFAQANPAAYEQVAAPIIQNYISALYNRALETTDKAQKDALLYTARVLDYDINKRYRQDSELTAPDPLSEREKIVNAKFQQIQQFQQSQQMAVVEQWNRSVDQQIDSEIDKLADSALSSIKAGTTQRIYNALKREFTDALVQHVAKDADGMRLLQIQRGEAQRRPSVASAAQIAREYVALASRAAGALRSQFLKEAGVAVKAQTDARLKAAQAAEAAGKSPTSSGPPRPQTIDPRTKTQYASKSEALDSSIDELLGVKK